MEDINRDDILFNMINKHSADVTEEERRREAAKKQAIIEHNNMLKQRAIATSLRREEVAREAAIRGKEISKERRKKVALILVGMATVAALMTPVAIKTTEKVIDYRDTSIAVNAMQNEAIEELHKYGLINEDGKEFNVTEPNTSISYQRLDISSPEEVYIYDTILSDTEFTKLIGSLGYDNFEEYLKKNNFSSEKEFTNQMRENILNSYRAELQKNGGNAR